MLKKNLLTICVSNVTLFEDMAAPDQVKAEITKLLTSFVKVTKTETIDFIYPKKTVANEVFKSGTVRLL